jgi:hypothetical protein
MDMIGQEHRGMNIALMFLRRRVELFQIKGVIVLCSENFLAIIAMLNDMLRLAGYYKAREACHGSYSLIVDNDQTLPHLKSQLSSNLTS